MAALYCSAGRHQHNVTGRPSKTEFLCVNKANFRVRNMNMKTEADKDVGDTRTMNFVTKALLNDMVRSNILDNIEGGLGKTRASW